MLKYVLILIMILVFQPAGIMACSIFKCVMNGTVYFCGNEDWSATDPALFALKAEQGSYGVVLFGWKSFLPNYPQAGINSEGLCFDWATVPAQPYTALPGKESLGINSTIDILKTCKNVDEVIAYIDKYNFSHLAEEHLMFADKNGNSCVFEYTKGSLKIVRNNLHTQFITNFNLTDKEKGWYPCHRFSSLESILNNEQKAKPDLKEVLEKVHQEGTYQTIYSYIFNLKTGDITLFYKHNFRQPKVYVLNDLIKKKQLLDIQ